MYIYNAMHSNQNFTDPLAGASTDALQPVIGSFLNKKAMQHDFHKDLSLAPLKANFLIDGVWTLVTEEFRDIIEYEEYYQISSFGRVYAYPRAIRRLRLGVMQVYTLKEKIMCSSINSNGYYLIKLSNNHKRKSFAIHALVAMAFIGHKPDGTNKLVVDHKDHNQLNNYYKNLQVISHRDNCSKDQFRHNRTSEYIGVNWMTKKNKWRAEIMLNGNRLYLGLFRHEIDASNAYQTALKNNLANGARK